jgi:catechol 2,3-dioxygenase-like lactoylglutathione lyase family enzyme
MAAATITGLDLLFLEVNNLAESLAFYHEQLGFEIESQNLKADPPIATVSASSLRITLVQQLETMLKRGRGVHFVLGVDDVEAFHRQLTANGVYVGEPRDEGWGGRFVSLQDPDGYRLFFVTWERGSRPTVREGACLNRTRYREDRFET